MSAILGFYGPLRAISIVDSNVRRVYLYDFVGWVCFPANKGLMTIAIYTDDDSPPIEFPGIRGFSHGFEVSDPAVGL